MLPGEKVGSGDVPLHKVEHDTTVVAVIRFFIEIETPRLPLGGISVGARSVVSCDTALGSDT